MWSDRAEILVTAVIVVMLIGASATVYAIDPGHEPTQQLANPAALEGESVFLAKGCIACHSREGVAGGGQIGPNLTDLVARAGDRVDGLSAKEYVRESVLNPQAFIVEGFMGIEMPTLALNGEELDALVGFLLSER